MYLGLDLSTQQLKALVVDDSLRAVAHSAVEFDRDLPHYGTLKGVFSPGPNEVQAPVAMWLEAVDLVFSKLAAQVDLGQVKAVSGACQQHGSVFWKKGAEDALRRLGRSASSAGDDSTSNADGSGSGAGLGPQLAPFLAWNLSPNWQDHSTAAECAQFEAAVGGPDQLAQITGSKAHHRFTGPQVLKLAHHQPEIYAATERISLVSSFLASVLSGKYAPLDIGDVGGMNLWSIQQNTWDERLIALLALPGESKDDVIARLGPVELESKHPVGSVSPYFVQKYGVSPNCKVMPFTGDNPGTILSVPLEPNDVIVSLGTSTTALIITEKYVPSPQYHLFAHPAAGRGYMGMLCYCNGALARENIRDRLNKRRGVTGTWTEFDKAVGAAVSVADSAAAAATEIGFYFPLAEIIPDCPPVIQRLVWSNGSPTAVESFEDPDNDALRILESQALSIRARLGPMLTTETGLPRKVYFVGGGSKNPAICATFANVLSPLEGAFTLDLTDACAKGAANLAAFGVNSNPDWDKFVASNWDQSRYGPVKYEQKGDQYKEAVAVFVASEKYLLHGQSP